MWVIDKSETRLRGDIGRKGTFKHLVSHHLLFQQPPVLLGEPVSFSGEPATWIA